MKIAAVVVTHNRLNLLQQCIDAIRNQTRKLDEIIVINNNSTDGTYEWLLAQRDITTITQENLGGAGGFYTGIKAAYEKGYDWIWCMDDDTIPTDSALENLINKIDNPNIGFICSVALWLDGNGNLMNVPKLFDPHLWIHNVLEKKKIPIKSCSFVSLLINKESIKKCGLPIKTFFIWLDDLEYTSRISLNNFECYLSLNSFVYHKTKYNYTPSLKYISNENKKNFYKGFTNWPTTLKTISQKKLTKYIYLLVKITIITFYEIIVYKKYKYAFNIFLNLIKGLIKIQKYDIIK